jgi:pantetheine-phosphate adenylyltransferase
MMVSAVYPGSFDPITLGHLDIVERASARFAKLWIAVAHNGDKHAWIPLADRLALIQASVAHLSNVFVAAIEGLTVEFARQQQAGVIVRGLRALSDFEKECAMAHMNKKLAPEIETIFLMASSEHQFLSSSLVKEVSRHVDMTADKPGISLAELVPQPVVEYVIRRASV